VSKLSVEKFIDSRFLRYVVIVEFSLLHFLFRLRRRATDLQLSIAYHECFILLSVSISLDELRGRRSRGHFRVIDIISSGQLFADISCFIARPSASLRRCRGCKISLSQHIILFSFTIAFLHPSPIGASEPPRRTFISLLYFSSAVLSPEDYFVSFAFIDARLRHAFFD